MCACDGALVLASLLTAVPAPSAPGSSPEPLAVPPALAARTSNPELSGIAWCAPLGRYLMVSDDTGLRGEGSYHAPWLLSLTPDGRIDADPVPVDGVDDINDPEAVTPGPDGTFFIVTSHSPDRKGRTRADRRMLLHVALDGRALRVLGRLDLTKVRKSDGDTLLAAAGLDPAGRLDIEAIAFRDGALYIGLKSPLSASGRAVILELDGVVASIRTGRMPKHGLRRWAEVALSVEPVGGGSRAAVFEGISDMTFLPDGSLALTANSPKGMPHDGGGALWHWKDARAGTGQPALLGRFPGLKPEGVSLAADRSSLVVVLDNDTRKPLWTRWPLPR